MMEWINYQNKCVLMNYTDIGQSYAAAYELLETHHQFQKNSFVIIALNNFEFLEFKLASLKFSLGFICKCIQIVLILFKSCLLI